MSEQPGELSGYAYLYEMCEGKSQEEIDGIIAQFRDVMGSPFFRAFVGVAKREREAAMQHFIESPDDQVVGALKMNEDRWRGHINAMGLAAKIPDQMLAVLSYLRNQAPKET